MNTIILYNIANTYWHQNHSNNQTIWYHNRSSIRPVFVQITDRADIKPTENTLKFIFSISKDLLITKLNTK